MLNCSGQRGLGKENDWEYAWSLHSRPELLNRCRWWLQPEGIHVHLPSTCGVVSYRGTWQWQAHVRPCRPCTGAPRCCAGGAGGQQGVRFGNTLLPLVPSSGTTTIVHKYLETPTSCMKRRGWAQLCVCPNSVPHIRTTATRPRCCWQGGVFLVFSATLVHRPQSHIAFICSSISLRCSCCDTCVDVF